MADVKIDGDDFTISVDPVSIDPAYFHDDGVVDFRVFGHGNKKSYATTTSARAATFEDTAEPAWVDPVMTAALVDDSASPVAAAATSKASIAATNGLERRGVHPLKVNRGQSKKLDMGAEDSAKDGGYATTSGMVTPMAVCNNYYTGASSVRSTTIGTTYPDGVSTGWMEVGSSLGGEYGVAFKYASGGSFEASGTLFKQPGWGFTWNPSAGGEARSYRKGIEYRYYQVSCNGALFGYEWRPYAESGGTSSNTGIERPTWNTYCSNVDKGTWYRQSTSGEAYSLGTGVKFADKIGIDLSVKRQYSSSQRAVYKIAGSNSKKLCGNSTYPSTSGKQIERLR